MSNTTIRIGGVPEHFNLPIHLAIEQKKFEQENINIEWQTFKGGTGEMTRALRENTCDLCVLLTEGIVMDIIRGNPAKIISGYVKTPLIWGIHTSVSNPINAHKDIFDRKFAVSRLGSGSHLMPRVDALMNEKELDQQQFVVVKNLDGAIDSLDGGESEIFYWEKFTTKPYVQKNKLKKISEFITPWPCFVIAATDHIIEKHPDIVNKALRIIHQQCDDFMNNEQAIGMVSERYDIALRDAARWFHSTEWAINGWVSDKMLSGVLYTLKEAGIIEENATTDQLIWKRNRRLD